MDNKLYEDARIGRILIQRWSIHAYPDHWATVFGEAGILVLCARDRWDMDAIEYTVWCSHLPVHNTAQQAAEFELQATMVQPEPGEDGELPSPELEHWKLLGMGGTELATRGFHVPGGTSHAL